jgi:glycosyltransferase involved in cell wall biosynthesis
LRAQECGSRRGALVRIAFVYVVGRVSRLETTQIGRSAREFFYGALELKERGHEVVLHEVDDGPVAKGGARIVDLLYRAHLMPSKTTASLLRQLRALAPSLNAADAVVATTSGIAYGLGVLKTVGALRAPLIAIHCGIVNYRLRARRRFLNGVMLRQMWTQLYGEGEIEPARRMFRIPAERIEVNQFGVDTGFWRPGSEKPEEYVLTVGNDARRDYDLLIRVAAQTGLPFVFITRHKLGQLPPNVEVRCGDWHAGAISDEELRALYQGARLVVVPLQQTVQPSGQSVCVQAMACGKPVVLTRTRGLWSQAMMRDGENVVLVEPGDATGLRSAILDIAGDAKRYARIGAAARETACNEADITQFADRLERRCESVALKGHRRVA